MNYIPERMIFVNRKDSTIAVPEGNKNVLKTAIKLLGNINEIKEIIIDNIPVSVKIKDYNWKTLGKKCWKVLYDDKFIVDMEEDALLELFKHTNINNGETEEKLIWARINGQSKLIMIDGKEYNQILKQSLKPKKEINHINKPNQLTYYRNSFCEEYLYLGLISVYINNIRQNFYGKVRNYNDDYYMKLELTKNPPQFIAELKKENMTKQEVIDNIVKKAKIMSGSYSYIRNNNINIMKTLELPFP